MTDSAKSALEALKFTPRLIDVLALLLQGRSNKLIARELGLSAQTISEYVSIILHRLALSSRTEVPLRVFALSEALLAWDKARGIERQTNTFGSKGRHSMSRVSVSAVEHDNHSSTARSPSNTG